MCNEDLSKLAILAHIEKGLRTLSPEDVEKVRTLVNTLKNEERQVGYNE